MGRLKDILQQQRKLNFVDRQKELDFFDRLLKQQPPSIHLLYIHGPGGQGKTTLLIGNSRTGEFVEFMETAAETGGEYSRFKIKAIAGGIKPVLHMHTTTDETFEIISGKVPRGQPAFLQLMVWGKNFQCKAYIASVPLGIQKALTFLLAPFGRLLGYKAIYKRFGGFDDESPISVRGCSSWCAELTSQ